MNCKKHIEGLHNNSYQDFRVLYDLFSGNLYGFVFGLIKSESLAKEIVQESFIRVWINREKIDPEQSFKSYLFKISRNLVIDNLRKQMSDPIFENYLEYRENLSLTESPEHIDNKIDFDLFVEELNKAKNLLPPRQKEIFELNKEQGIPVAEIASLLNISEQTIYNQLSSALKTLKKELKPINIFLLGLFFGIN